MRRQLFTLGLSLMLALTPVLVPLGATSAMPVQAAAGVPVPVTGTFTDDKKKTGTFTGTLNIQRFADQGGQLVAVGTLTGTLTSSVGTCLGTVLRTITVPVTGIQIQGICEILHLELGPLDLNLLGLVIHLDKVVLDITAQPGTLLGGLLCALAGLLNPPGGLLQAIVDLLNQILGQL